MKCLLSFTTDFFNIHLGMEKNENLPVDNQIKMVSDEKDALRKITDKNNSQMWLLFLSVILRKV